MSAINNLTSTIKDSFTQFSAAVLQSRALVDARDCIKPSTRQIFYCMYTDKFVHSKPFQKTLKAIGSAFRMYIHGDSSVEGIIMRAGQPFAYRYPLVEVEGSYGTLIESGSWSAPRYTAARLSPLAEYLFKDLEKDVIKNWAWNYDDTEQYPLVLPSKGFYNLVNGNFGIAVGAASSIPQYNLKEMNKALETLLLNPDCDFDEIYCIPDFATGAVLLNEKEVKESHRNGTGFACKLRAVVEYDKRERVFIVKEIPFMTYTNSICRELEEIINGENNPGIERFNDLTGEKVNLKIYLTKKANPDKILKFLYKNTSLQSHYGVNFTVLEDGRFPKVFTWRQLLQSHIAHEKEVYLRGFQFDLRKIENRLHIVDALLKVIASIDEVIHTIKTSESTVKARQRLMSEYELDEVQAKAVLEIKLSRLAHLEVEKLKTEKADLEKEKSRITTIINDETLFNNELIKGWREVAEEFGDERRTKVLNISTEDEEPKEIKQLSINLSNQNNLYIQEISTLYSQTRGGVGKKFKMSKGEFVISTQQGDNKSILLLFTKNGNCYHADLADMPIEEIIPIESVCPIGSDEETCFMMVVDKNSTKDSNTNLIFFTKKGYMKKSLLSEYNITRKTGIKALTLEQGDEICSVIVNDDCCVGMLTARGQFVICESRGVRPIGRVARGVRGIKLNEGDYLISANKIPKNTKEIISVSEKGYIKKTPISDFNITNRDVKGSKIHNLKDENDKLVAFLPISNESDVIVVANNAQIKIKLSEVALLGKGAQGTKSMKISNNAKIIGMTIF